MSKEELQQQRNATGPSRSSDVEMKTPGGDEKTTRVTIIGANGVQAEKINQTFEISSKDVLHQNDGHYVYRPVMLQDDTSGSNASRIVFFKNKWYIMADEKLDDETLSKGNILLMNAVVDCPTGKDNCELKDCVSQKWSEYQDAGSGKVTTKENANIKMTVTGDFSDIPSKLEVEPVSPAAASVAPEAASVASGGPSVEVAKVSPPPGPTPLAVPKIQTLEEMKTVVANINKEYDNISTEYKKLSPESSELDWTNFQTKFLTPAKSKLVEASSQLEAYKNPKGVEATSLLAPEVDKSQGSESSKKQYETLLSILKDIPDMKQSCQDNNNFIPISIFLILTKQAIDKSTLSKDVIDTSLLEPKYFLAEHDASSSTNAVTMKDFIAGIIIHSILEIFSGAKIVETQAAAAAATETQAEVNIDRGLQPLLQREPSVQREPSAFSFMNQGGGDITKDSKINCKLYQAVLDTISSFDLDVNSTESLGDILIIIIGYMSTDKFKKMLREKWDKVTESGYDGGSSLSKYKKNKKSYKSHKSYHPKIGKTRKHHNSHNKPKKVLFVHQA
jgi:hypothetical protein